MNKNVIIQQKIEKERLAEKPYIVREAVQGFRKNLDNNLIKIITGPRRAGKSVFCFELLKGKDFAYLNFDDENLLKFRDYDKIEPLLHEVYPGHKYIFLDEIQNLENWELFVNKLHRRGANLVITGSNAKLLAKEMATALTGRFIAQEVLTFSFREYLAALKVDPSDLSPQGRGSLLAAMEKYMAEGGFPETVVSPIDVKLYLGTLFDAVIFKDVASRHKIHSPKGIYDLALFMASNPACEFSFREMAEFAGLKSAATLIKYASFLQESYLFELMDRFDFGVKKQRKSPKKIYLTDNGFMHAKGQAATDNKGRLFENMCYGHLRRSGYVYNRDIFYYRHDNGGEIDFVLKKGTAVEKLVQASYDITSPKTLERELKPLAAAAEKLRCKNLELITWDDEGEERYRDVKVKITPAWKMMAYNDADKG